MHPRYVEIQLVPMVTEVPVATEVTEEPSVPVEPRGYRTKMGKWEEIYDETDGTKTWHNTETRVTTAKDPFM